MDNAIDFKSELWELYSRYLANTRLEIQKIEVSVEQKNFSQIASSSHKIKGTASSYGLEGLYVLIVDLESSAHQERLGDVERIVADLLVFFEEVESRYQQLVRKSS